MIAVSLNVGGGVRLIKPAKLHVHARHYKHNKDGRTAPGVCGNGSVPLSHPGNAVTRIGTHTHISKRYLGGTKLGYCRYQNHLLHFLNIALSYTLETKSVSVTSYSPLSLKKDNNKSLTPRGAYSVR